MVTGGIRVTICGELQIDVDGRRMESRLPGAQGRGLFVYLILQGDRAVTRAELIDAVWGAAAPAAPGPALRALLSKLRAAIAPATLDGTDPLQITFGGAGARVDVTEAAAELRAAEDAASQHDWRAVREAAGRAAAVFGRGPAIRYEGAWFETWESELRESWRRAIELSARAALAHGRDAAPAAAGLARRLIAADSLDERAYALLLEAHEVAGTAAEGLVVFDHLRRRLNAELGVPPSRELIERHRRLLALTEDADATRVPLPPPLRADARLPFAGRVTEMDRLTAVLGAARDGCRVALLSGEPGMGKTRLARRFVRRAHDDGATVLHGRCSESIRAPYQVWADALRHYVEGASDDVLRAFADRHGGELERLVPELRRRIPGLPEPRSSDAETERYLLFGAVAGLLTDAASRAPLVLLLDDLQWADPPSVLLLGHVLSAVESARVVIVAVYREEDLAADHGLLGIAAKAAGDGRVERLALEGLDDDAILEIVRAEAGDDVGDSGRVISAALARETGGNPLFAIELLRRLLETGALARGEDGGWTTEAAFDRLELPETVREVIRRRVEALGPAAVTALGVAAVIGREFDVDLLARVLEASPDAVLDVVDRGLAASLLVERPSRPGRVGFAHALIGNTLYDGLSRARAASLHRRVAVQIEALHGRESGDRVADLARHWDAAGDVAAAREYSRRAGDAALRALAPAEALRWFRRAWELAWADPPVDRGALSDILYGLGEAERRNGEPGSSERLVRAAEVAREVGDTGRMCRAVLANTRGWQSDVSGADQARVTMIDAALDAVAETDPAQRARLLALRVLELLYDTPVEERLELTAEAVTLARSTGDPRVLAEVLTRTFYGLLGPVALDLRITQIKEARTLLPRIDDPDIEFWATTGHAAAMLEAGELDQSRRLTERIVATAADLQQPNMRWMAHWSLAMHAHIQGRLDDAEREAATAFEVGAAAGEPDALSFYAAQLWAVRYEQGRVAELLPALEAAASQMANITGFMALLALSYADVGRLEEARRAFAQRPPLDEIPVDTAYTSALAFFAEIAARLGDAEAAAPVYDALLPWRGLMIYSGIQTQCAVEHYLGRTAATMGREDAAVDHFEAACATHERIGAPVFLARSQVALGALLQRRADEAERERGAALLSAARAAAEERGAGAVARAAAAAAPSHAPSPVSR